MLVSVMKRGRYVLRCRVCGKGFQSYEEYALHVFSDHPDKLWARFRPEVVAEGD